MKEQVFREFNEKGIFPSDQMLDEIARGDPEKYDDLYDVELELLALAKDVNHPYHHKVYG